MLKKKKNATLPTITNINVKDSLLTAGNVCDDEEGSGKAEMKGNPRKEWTLSFSTHERLTPVSLNSSHYVSGTGTLMKPVKQATKPPVRLRSPCPCPTVALSPARAASG